MVISIFNNPVVVHLNGKRQNLQLTTPEWFILMANNRISN